MVWSSTWTYNFFYHQLTCLQVQKPGADLNSAKQIIKVYLRVKQVPFPFLLHPCCLNPKGLFIIFLLMSSSFGVMWWRFRFIWIYIYKVCIYFTYIIYIHTYIKIWYANLWWENIRSDCFWSWTLLASGRSVGKDLLQKLKFLEILLLCWVILSCMCLRVESYWGIIHLFSHF